MSTGDVSNGRETGRRHQRAEEPRRIAGRWIGVGDTRSRTAGTFSFPLTFQRHHGRLHTRSRTSHGQYSTIITLNILLN